MIVSEHPCPNDINKIPYPIFNQDVLILTFIQILQLFLGLN